MGFMLGQIQRIAPGELSWVCHEIDLLLGARVAVPPVRGKIPDGFGSIPK